MNAPRFSDLDEALARYDEARWRLREAILEGATKPRRNRLRAQVTLLEEQVAGQVRLQARGDAFDPERDRREVLADLSALDLQHRHGEGARVDDELDDLRRTAAPARPRLRRAAKRRAR